jgi:hypothetical protein
MKKFSMPAYSALLEALNDNSQDVRRKAMDALHVIGPLPSSTIPLLFHSLKSKAYIVRAGSAKLLGTIPHSANGTVSSLRNAACDPDCFVRFQAREALKVLAK